MRSLLVSIVAVTTSLFAAGCSSSDEDAHPPSPGSPAVTPGEAAPSNLEKTACRFAVPRSLEGDRYACYDLVVPENRAVGIAGGSRTIKVHTIVFKGRPGGTPTLELNGGPGGPSEDIAVMLALGEGEPAATVGRFLEVGDYVLVDQRGTGRSVPRLNCDPSDLDRGPVEGGKACAKRYADQGVDLTGYVTSENAEDIHDLKVALGAAKVNLHAISYGTRLALEVLRHHGDDVAAAIIDGVMPAQAKALSEGSTNFDQIITKIFSDCAADPKCNAAWPNLEQSLKAVKAKLDAKPFSFMGQPYDWYAFWGELAQNLYGEGVAGTVPQRIHHVLAMTQADFDAEASAMIEGEERYYAEEDARLGATDLGREVLQRRREDRDPEAGGMADGMYLSVVCSDYAQYESVDEALALESKVRAEVRNDEAVRDTFSACDPWPKRAKGDGVFAPVASARPVLAVGGAYDPATPVKWRDLAAETLSKGLKATMAAGAHGALDPCAMGFKMAFLGAPDSGVDVSCGAAQKIVFSYDDAPAPSKFHRRTRQLAAVRPLVQSMPLTPAAITSRWSERARPNAPRLFPRTTR